MIRINFTDILKRILLDVLMLGFFLILVSFVLWIIWMYFFRGPIDMETRGYVTESLKEMIIQPSDSDRYMLQHFHNLDSAVLKGIEYPSKCLICHDVYPHNKNPKVRSFFNAHSWFIDCDVCHVDYSNRHNIVYKWLDSDTDIALYKLDGEPGQYEARIVPLVKQNGEVVKLDNAIKESVITNYLITKDTMSESQAKDSLNEIHKPLAKNPFFCDQCHTENGKLKFEDLLYSETKVEQLKTLDVGTMIKGYDVFHLPKMY